jgi:hypothetical protein
MDLLMHAGIVATPDHPGHLATRCTSNTQVDLDPAIYFVRGASTYDIYMMQIKALFYRLISFSQLFFAQ